MSIMSLPLLIIGGNLESRKETALNISLQSTSKFDVNILDTKDDGGIDTIRNLNQALHRRPFQSKFQVALIFEAQNLTIEAQNAFLKNLEEAPEHAKIVLTAATAESLLSTIISRCEKFELPAQNDETINWDFFLNYLNLSTYQKFRLADKLDIPKWDAFWRDIFLSLIDLKTLPVTFSGNLKKILNYLRIINRMNHLKRKNVSPKLLKALLILEIPKIEILDKNKS